MAKGPGGYGATAGSAGAAEGFRMQATALGSYLLYGRDRDFMAGDGLTKPSRPPAKPSAAADWRVDVSAGETCTITLPSAGKALAVLGDQLVFADSGSAEAFTFEPAEGCAVYPEVETGATGSPFTSRTPWGEVKGTSTSTCT